ncbi:TPA: hypothetical protein DCX16_03130 [bacterium]|nr:hypothetical protein [bacterium]
MRHFLFFLIIFIIGCCKLDTEKQLQKEINVKKENAYFLKAQTYFEKGSLTFAEEEVKKSLQNNLDDPKLWFLLGRIYDKKNEDSKAIDAYVKAIQLSQENLDEKTSTSTCASPFMLPLQKGDYKEKP